MEYGPRKPTKKFLSEFLVLAGLHVLLFMVVYKFTNSTAHSLDPDQLLHYYHPLELEIPFIPEWFVVYYSINLMLSMPLFFLTVHRFRRYIVAQVLATFIAAFFFYFFPFDCG